MKIEIELTDMNERIMNILKDEHKKVIHGYITPEEFADRIQMLGNLVSDMFYDCNDKESFNEVAKLLNVLGDVECKMRYFDEELKKMREERLSKMELPF